MFNLFLNISLFIIIPAYFFAHKIPENTALGFIGGLLVSLLLALLLAKQSNFMTAKRSLINSLVSAKHKNSSKDAQIGIESFLLFLKHTGLSSTHKELKSLLDYFNINAMDANQLDTVIKYLLTIKTRPIETMSSILKI